MLFFSHFYVSRIIVQSKKKIVPSPSFIEFTNYNKLQQLFETNNVISESGDQKGTYHTLVPLLITASKCTFRRELKQNILRVRVRLARSL